MHELSIAQRLVELAEEQLAGELPCRVTGVRVRVGPLSGVVPEALRFAFDEAAAGTLLDGARLEIEPVGLVAFCEGCGCDVVPESVQRLRCPACGAATPDVRRGRELELVSLEVIDAAADAGAGTASESAGAAADRAGPPADPQEE